MHKGPTKDINNVKAMIKLLLECGDKAPTFVAKDLNRLPPVSFDSLDVSALLGRLQKLEGEMTALRKSVMCQAKFTEDIQLVTSEMDSRMSAISTVQEASSSTPTMSTVPVPQEVRSENLWTQVVRRGGKRKAPYIEPNSSQAQKQPQERPHPKKKPGIVGTATVGKIQAVKTKKVNVFATRFDPDLDSTILQECLKERLNDSVKCRKIERENARFSSFQVTALCNEVNELYAPDIWPDGIFVRRYYEPRKQGSVTLLEEKSQRESESQREP